MLLDRPGSFAVVGGSSGIGRALTDRLLVRGPVVVLDRVDAPNERASFVRVDLTKHDERRLAVSRLPEDLIGVAFTAGVAGTTNAIDTLDNNFLAPVALTQEFLLRFPSRLSLVFVASISDRLPRVPSADTTTLMRTPSLAAAAALVEQHQLTASEAYPLSKELLIRWVRGLAARGIAAGVRANLVSPGPVRTQLLESFRRTIPKDAVNRAEKVVGRHAEPADVAGVLEFLLTDERSAWINGTNLTVDGGVRAHLDSR